MAELSWFNQKRVGFHAFKSYFTESPFLGRTAKLYTKWSGLNALKNGAKVTGAGLEKTADTAELGARAGVEAGKGIGQMTVSPFAMLVKSRLVAVKRMMWDLPWATASAALRTPIAVATSPFRAAGAVRQAIFKDLPNNIGEVFNGLKAGRIQGVRKTVSDLLLKPAGTTFMPMVTPTGQVFNTALGAQLQTATTLAHAATVTIPEGGRRVWNSVHTARAQMEEIIGERTRKRNAMKEYRQAQKEQMEELVDNAKGVQRSGNFDKDGNFIKAEDAAAKAKK